VITVACVEWDNYLGRADEYIRKLQAMVRRHLAQPHQFCILLPDDSLQGWWKKLALFKPGRFTGRVVYFDLDTLIVGPLDELVSHKGAVHLSDWGWVRNVHAGGTLVWDAGERDHLWNDFTPAVTRAFANDQEWMTTLNCWERLPPHIVRSYRYHCKAGPPPGCSVVAFHGSPKMHELPANHWVHEHWLF